MILEDYVSVGRKRHRDDWQGAEGGRTGERRKGSEILIGESDDYPRVYTKRAAFRDPFERSYLIETIGGP